jgi:hypothetical protein
MLFSTGTHCFEIFCVWKLSASYRGCYGVDKGTVSRCIQRVSYALASKTDQFIKWPSDQKREIKQGFYERRGFPCVIGCVDGTHVRITAPNVDEPSFVNRQGFHSLNV